MLKWLKKKWTSRENYCPTVFKGDFFHIEYYPNTDNQTIWVMTPALGFTSDNVDGVMKEIKKGVKQAKKIIKENSKNER